MYIFFFFLVDELYCELAYHDQKIRTPMHDSVSLYRASVFAGFSGNSIHKKIAEFKLEKLTLCRILTIAEGFGKYIAVKILLNLSQLAEVIFHFRFKMDEEVFQ